MVHLRLSVFVFVIAFCTSFAVGQKQEPQPAQSPQPASTPPADRPKSDQPSAAKPGVIPNQPPGFGHDHMVDRRIAAFVRLRELVFEQVKLEPEKRQKINRMFDDYMAGLLSPKFKPHSQPRPEDFATPQQLPKLRKELETAQQQNDQEKIESLKAKIYAANIVLEPHVVDEPIFFFNYVYAELSDEQKKQFDPILDRWRLLRVAELAPDNAYKHLRRSVRDPLLKRSEKQGKELDDLIIEGYRTVPFEKRNDQAVMRELAKEYKPKVMEKLDERQRQQLEKTLAMLEEWEKVDSEVARKTREQLKDHKPEHDPVQAESSPTLRKQSSPSP